MICPNCQANNEDLNVFCIVCGTMLKNTGAMGGDTKSPTLSFQNPSNEMPTVFAQSNPNIPPTQIYSNPNSVETSFAANNPQMHNFAPFNMPNAATQQNAGSGKKAALLAMLIFFGLAALSAGGYFLITKTSVKSETLPTHLGMFVQSSDKDKVDEIKKKDFANALVAKDELLNDDALPGAEGNPNLLLYSDSKEISLNDLRLIQLDTIKPDGSMKQLDFQAAPVDGKPDIKRIRIPDGLANGKYAFAILDGDLDDGKHKFWAFQIKNSEKSNNDSTLESFNVSLKPKDKPTTTTSTNNQVVQKAIVPQPAGTSVHRLNIGNVVLRSGPSQSYPPNGNNLPAGHRVYVFGYSSESETFINKRGKVYNSNYAEVLTESGRRGWIYAAFIN